MIKKYYKYGLVALGILIVAGLVYLGTTNRNQTMGGVTIDGPVLGGNFEDSSWSMVQKFQGWETSADASKISDGATPNGQNVIINDGDRISIRNFGYEVLGTSTTTDDPITSLHTFRKRSGENLLMRSYNTYLEYYEEGNDTWESLRTTSTADAIYGYADYNINTDLRSYVYFGNAADAFARWNGAHSLLTQAVVATTGTIHVADTTDFLATGNLRYCDRDYAYSAKTATTFVVASAPVNCASGRSVTQAIDEFASNPRGNIYLNASNRIFVAGVTTTPQAIYFSKYGDAETYLTTLISTSTADAAGIFNLGEGGGAVTGMVMDEGAIYAFKSSIIYRITLDDSLYTLSPLKPFDGRSQTTGALTARSVFVGGNGVYYVTPDTKIMSLQRVEYVDYPQVKAISDPIQTTANELVFDNVSGISWRDYAFFTVKSSSDIDVNDTVLLYNEKVGAWETPVIGWAASEFTVYDDGTGEALYFGDAATANVYKVNDVASDNELDVTANWRSKRFDFGVPQLLKEMSEVYIEGYISDNTTLSISLLLDEDGYSQTFTTELAGTENDYILQATPYNILGLHPFGYLRFGSSEGTAKRKFRVYLSKDFRATPFYNAQMEFASDGDAQDWEITSFGMKARLSPQGERRSLYRSFK